MAPGRHHERWRAVLHLNLSSTAQQVALTVVEQHGKVVALAVRSLFTWGSEYATTSVFMAAVKGSSESSTWLLRRESGALT